MLLTKIAQRKFLLLRWDLKPPPLGVTALQTDLLNDFKTLLKFIKIN